MGSVLADVRRLVSRAGVITFERGSARLDVQDGRVGVGAIDSAYALNIAGGGAMRLPGGATAFRPSSPVAGMLRFNSDIPGIEYYDGTSWVQIAGQSLDARLWRQVGGGNGPPTTVSGLSAERVFVVAIHDYELTSGPKRLQIRLRTASGPHDGGYWAACAGTDETISGTPTAHTTSLQTFVELPFDLFDWDPGGLNTIIIRVYNAGSLFGGSVHAWCDGWARAYRSGTTRRTLWWAFQFGSTTLTGPVDGLEFTHRNAAVAGGYAVWARSR